MRAPRPLDQAERIGAQLAAGRAEMGTEAPRVIIQGGGGSWQLIVARRATSRQIIRFTDSTLLDVLDQLARYVDQLRRVGDWWPA